LTIEKERVEMPSDYFEPTLCRACGLRAAAIGFTLLAALPCFAAGLTVTPAEGQSAAQQQRDEQECREWASQRSGIDPGTLARPEPQTAPPDTQRRDVLVGSAAGAAVGALVGSMKGEVVKGAVIGAGVGAAGGAIVNQEVNRRRVDAETGAQIRNQDRINQFERAYKSCLQKRGYAATY
jgi:hypothetical protein